VVCLKIDDPDLMTKLSILKVFNENFIAWDGISQIDLIGDKCPLMEEYYQLPGSLSEELTQEYTSIVKKEDLRRVLINYPSDMFDSNDIFHWACLMFDSNSIKCDLSSTRSALQQLTMGGRGFDEEDRQIVLDMLEH
jgi:hypothetical protein